MTTEETNTTQTEPVFFRQPNKGGRIMAGFIVVIIGAVLLLKNTGVQFPEWLFTWQMFLIVLGIFIGAKHSFQRGGWWIVSLVGIIFMMDEFFYNLSIGNLFWPIIIIAAGLVMIFKPKKRWHNEEWRNRCEQKFNKRYSKTSYSETSNREDYIESVSIFGGVKKNIISKDFKGGEIVCVFGGAEVNMMQADINGRAELEVVNVFGGTKLLIPAHWEIQHQEMVAILGGIEDKRPPYTDKTGEGTKVLVIKGTSVFGGIDIRSY